MTEKTIALNYTGNHPAGEYLPDVPPRDLSEAEAAACGYSVEELVQTNFYAASVSSKEAAEGLAALVSLGLNTEEAIEAIKNSTGKAKKKNAQA
jgi:hypothetical protein